MAVPNDAFHEERLNRLRILHKRAVFAKHANDGLMAESWKAGIYAMLEYVRVGPMDEAFISAFSAFRKKWQICRDSDSKRNRLFRECGYDFCEAVDLLLGANVRYSQECGLAKVELWQQQPGGSRDAPLEESTFIDPHDRQERHHSSLNDVFHEDPIKEELEEDCLFTDYPVEPDEIKTEIEECVLAEVEMHQQPGGSDDVFHEDTIKEEPQEDCLFTDYPVEPDEIKIEAEDDTMPGSSEVNNTPNQITQPVAKEEETTVKEEPIEDDNSALLHRPPPTETTTKPFLTMIRKRAYTVRNGLRVPATDADRGFKTRHRPEPSLEEIRTATQAEYQQLMKEDALSREREEARITAEAAAEYSRRTAAFKAARAAAENVVDPSHIVMAETSDHELDNAAFMRTKAQILRQQQYLRDGRKRPREADLILVACTQCPVKLSRSELQDHYARAHNNPRRSISCEKCMVPFRSTSALAQHRIRMHAGASAVSVTRKFKCPHCKGQEACEFTTESIMSNHIRKVHGNRPYTCNSCTSAFFYREDLRKHMIYQHKH
ncbi:hypothetical protein PMAYCL1PPCAC_04842 [Pristionchus mayeri]|uniref:C2H2-type domain-containing protein n=1 Tax=Pristionchus mayeri TaxID=1317129 RepID=A0AAN4ZBC9_9BILA|nr:hypothetical protein PMAYCL1PPCAC_04842 [Pristionchus mayeri]